MSQPAKEIEEAKIFAVVAYWGLLCILPLLLKKDNKFAVYHGKQGLVLFIFLVGGFLFSIIPFLGQLVWRLVLFLYICAFLWGSLQALMGRCGRIPLVSNIAGKITV